MKPAGTTIKLGIVWCRRYHRDDHRRPGQLHHTTALRGVHPCHGLHGLALRGVEAKVAKVTLISIGGLHRGRFAVTGS